MIVGLKYTQVMMKRQNTKKKHRKSEKKLPITSSPNKSEEKESTNQKQSQSPGSFEKGDIPLKIVKASRNETDPKLLLCEVEWKNNNNYKPLNSFYTNREIKKIDPAFLCNFYESKMLIPK